jgi:thymidylate kinase
MIIVELTGIPGAGKTTLATTLVTALENQGLEVLDPETLILTNYKIPKVGNKAPRTILVDLLLSKWAMSAMQDSEIRQMMFLGIQKIWTSPNSKLISLNLIRNFVKKIGIDYFIRQYKRPGSKRVVIWDEGIIHSHQLVFVHTHSTPDKKCLKQFFNLMPTPDLIVGLRAPLSDAQAALTQRGSSWKLPGGQTRIGKTPAEIEQYLEHANQAFTSLVEHPRCENKILILDRDETVSPDKIVTRVMHLLSQANTAIGEPRPCH